MNFKYHPYLFYCIVLIFFLALHLSASAQQVIVNSKGEKIIIYPDGTWRLYEKTDSIGQQEHLTKEEFILPDQEDNNNPESQVDPKFKDLQTAKFADDFKNMVSKQMEVVKRNLSVAIDMKFDAEAKVQEAVLNKTLIEPDILEGLEVEYQTNVENVKTLKTYHHNLSRIAQKADRLPDLPGKKKDKALSKLISEYEVITGLMIAVKNRDHSENTISSLARSQYTSPDPKGKAEIAGSPDRYVPGSKSAKKYQSAPVECIFEKDEEDRVTRQRTRILKKKFLLSHTDIELRQYFHDNELVTCNGYLSQISGKTFLSIEFKIASTYARKNFGSLNEGSLLRLSLLDGSIIDLYSLQRSPGVIDQYTGNTVFTGHYLLEKSAERLLKKSELDKIRILWSTGYEDYEVYYVDFFIDQFSCLYGNL